MTIKQQVRSGAWVTPARIRNYSILFLILSVILLGYLALTAEGIHDYEGRVLGTDFSNVYAAGTYVQDGASQLPFDPERQFERQKKLFGECADFYGWHYPPYFLLLAFPLAAMPYLVALIVYQLATFGAYLWAMRTILPLQQAWLPAIGFGSVVINMGHGNNGFLTASLFAGGLVALRKRPLLAGLLLGCLIYKPQYGIFIPFALAAGGYWRAFFAATLSVIFLSALTVAAFGIETWQAFVDHLGFTRSVVFEQGDTGFYKMQSLFAQARTLGASPDMAYALQGGMILFALLGVIGIWRSSMDIALKASALLVATLLAVPYSFDYDLMLLAPAIAFYVQYGLRPGFPPYAKTILALCWFMPFFARPFAQHTEIFLAPICLLALFVTLRCYRSGYRGYGKSPA